MRTFQRLIFTFLLIALGLRSTLYSAGAGTTGGSFLKLGVGARPVAMGEAFLAISDDSHAMLWNPGGISQIKYPELSVMHLQWIADITYEYVGYSMPFKNQGLGFGVTWLNVAPFDSTGGNGAPAGSAGDIGLLGSYGLSVTPELSLGATARTFMSSLADQSNFGGSLDVGLLFKPFGRELTFALVAQNLGLQTQFETESDPLPMNIRIGTALRLYNKRQENWFNLALDVNKSIDNRFKFNTGMEVWLFNTLALRGGYKLSEGGSDFDFDDPSALANFTAGAGFRLSGGMVDYAFAPFGELGITHRVSLTYQFGYKPAEVPPDQVLKATPKFANLGPGREVGVTFDTDFGKRSDLTKIGVKEWRVDIKDKDGKVIRTLAGQGPVPKNLAWDGRSDSGSVINRDQPYVYDFTVRDNNGRAIRAGGAIAQEVKPKNMLSSRPSFDSNSGGMMFTPRASISAGVKEWTLKIRSQDGRVLRTVSGKGAIPKTLQADIALKDLDTSPGSLIGGRQIRQIAYEIEFKDAAGQTRVMQDQMRVALGERVAQAAEESYRLPLPTRDFKVNRGREILVAAIPNLTSSRASEAKPLPFVMTVPEAKEIKRWRFEIVSPEGKMVRRYSGQSAPPDNIFWDGKDQNGNIVKNASNSRFSFWVVDETGKELQSRGGAKEVLDPFQIDSIQGKIQKISGIWFRFLDTDIQEAVLGTLRRVARLIKQNPKVKVTIQGHSWDEGPSAEMLRLSQERADAVLRFLIEEEGVSPRNVSAIGYGDAMPLKKSGEDASDQNRRVEVVVISQ